MQPDEIYNLGAPSHVAVSFEAPEYTANSDALGTLRILRLKGFPVVGSMENPPTNPVAVAQARGGQG